MLLLVLIALLLIALFGGIGYGYPRYGAYGFSPLLFVLLIIVLLIAFGGVHYP